MTLYGNGKRRTRACLSFCYLYIEFFNKTLRKIDKIAHSQKAYLVLFPRTNGRRRKGIVAVRGKNKHFAYRYFLYFILYTDRMLKPLRYRETGDELAHGFILGSSRIRLQLPLLSNTKYTVLFTVYCI